jgi:hypothetical protein
VKCISVVRGTRRSAIASVARRLRKQGFRSGCSDDRLGALELIAVREGIRVSAEARPGVITFDESDGGKPLDVVDGRFVSGPSRPIPAGSVGLKIDVDKLESRMHPYPLPAGACP